MTLIVTGITRSGLTMTMQMLHAGGYPCAGEYPGFEPYDIGEIPWDRCEGLAVKLVDAQLHFPPRGRYSVIRLHRDRRQQCLSINKFNAVSGLPPAKIARMKALIRRDYKAIDRWACRQDRLLRMHFESIIQNPRMAAERLAKWVGGDLDVERMAAAVITRNTDCHPRLLELDMIRKCNGAEVS